MFKKFTGLIHGHFQYISNAFSFKGCFQGFPIVTFPLTNLTGNIDIRQEVQFDLDDTIPLAGFTTPALYIKAKAAFFVSPGFGLFAFGKDFPNGIEYTGIGCRIASGSTADRALINGNDLIQILQASDLGIIFRHHFGAVQLVGQGMIKNIIDKSTFSGAGNTGYRHKNTQWNFHINMF